MSQASNQISATYNEQYLNESSEWRNLGGKQKSSNIKVLPGAIVIIPPPLILTFFPILKFEPF